MFNFIYSHSDNKKDNQIKDHYYLNYVDDNRPAIKIKYYTNPLLSSGKKRPYRIKFVNFIAYTDDELLEIFNYLEELIKCHMLFEDDTDDKIYFDIRNNGGRRYHELTGKRYFDR